MNKPSTPVDLSAIQEKLAKLGVTEKDVPKAIAWARKQERAKPAR